MPCAMMHLACAKYYDNNADIGFYIGNLSPDCIDIREFKDKNHLRIYKDSEREDKLLEFARTLDLDDPYQFGVLLHLYTDMCWDRGPMAKHQREYKGESWFKDYRQEIRYIGSYMYTQMPWAPTLWDEMYNTEESAYCTLSDYPTDNIKAYIERNRNWHAEVRIGPSEYFDNLQVMKFCEETVKRFKKFIKPIL